jgi:hypothetical protein
VIDVVTLSLAVLGEIEEVLLESTIAVAISDSVPVDVDVNVDVNVGGANIPGGYGHQ